MIQLTDVFCVLFRYYFITVLQYAADSIVRDPIKQLALYWKKMRKAEIETGRQSRPPLSPWQASLSWAPAQIMLSLISPASYWPHVLAGVVWSSTYPNNDVIKVSSWKHYVLNFSPIIIIDVLIKHIVNI